MSVTRRDFLKQGLMSGAGLVLSSCATFKGCQETIAKRPIRRDVNTLDPNGDIMSAYRSAIVQMKALPASDPRNWTRQASIHNEFCPHGNWLFLPWHRGYLAYFERICRKLSGMQDFALPYWDWSRNPSLPAAFWGDPTNPLFIPGRAATPGENLPATAVGPAVLDDILNEENFLLFASGALSATANQHDRISYGPLEGTPHNTVHGFVGGQMGTFMSPLDPIFWLHHNMIERCWVDWNLVRGHSNTNDAAWTGRNFPEFFDEDGSPAAFNVNVGLLLPVLSYQYDVPIARPGGRARLAGPPVAEGKASEEHVKRGARTQLEFVRRFSTPVAAQATLDAPVRVQVSLGNEDAARSSNPRLRNVLVLDGVELEHTEDFFVHVFLNKPDASASTPPEDPSFAGSFAFFGHAHAGHAAIGKYILDVGPTLRRLNIVSGQLDVTLVLVPFPNRTPRTRSLSLKSVELGIVDSAVLQNPT